MSDTTFTPGPWKIIGHGHGTAIRTGDKYRENHTMIAWISENAKSGNPAWEHNARLIAAAPEMYALLDEIHEECERLEYSGMMLMLRPMLLNWELRRAKINEVQP